MPHFPKPFFKQSRRLWYVEINRKQVCLGPDPEEAFKRYHALMQQPRLEVGQSPTIPIVADAFLEWVKKERSPETFEWYRQRLEKFCQLHPGLQVSALRPFHLQQWVDSIPGLSRTTRRNYFRSVKRCVAWAEEQGYVDKNPIAHLSVPGADHREISITTEEYQDFVRLVPDPALRDLLVVTWETGCRPQESLRVEARHVDLERKRWVFPKSESKGKRQPRVVYLTEAALEITSRLMKQFPSGPLFRNSDHRPWTTDAVNCAFARVQGRMGRQRMRERGVVIPEAEITEMVATLKPTRTERGVSLVKSPAELREEAKRKLTNRMVTKLTPRYSLYALRHAWATRALESGLDGLTVAVLMGHSDPSTLARVYQHLSHNPEHLLAQARKATARR